jgi:hypothetical protein
MSKEEERIFVDFEPNDFIIRISPVLDDDDLWTGELSVGYLTLDENFLNATDYSHVDMVTNLTLSVIPLMEEDLELRNKLYKYTTSMLEKEGKPVVETQEDSNIIKLRFS